MIRNAVIKDVEEILTLINSYAAQGLMLKKTPYDIYRNLQNFIVWEENGRVFGCASLVIFWKNAAEVASLAVSDKCRRQGIGRKLVSSCIDKARNLGLPMVFSLTYEEAFFQSCGFSKIAKESLPHKVFRDCRGCPKASCCDEKAYLYDITSENINPRNILPPTLTR